MADSSGVLRRPPSLKVFLDAGGDLTAPDIWEERLAEVVYLDLPFAPPGERARRAADARAKALKAGTRRCGWRRRDRQLQRERVRYWHWVADLYEAPELAQRLAAALPADLTGAYEALTEEFRRPHPLVLRTPEQWWSCHNCGRSFDQGQERAVMVTGHQGVSDMAEEINYCTGCLVATLAEVAR